MHFYAEIRLSLDNKYQLHINKYRKYLLQSNT